jgi:hypothetical protein
MGVSLASPEFLAACRAVLGDDSPATVLDAIQNGDPRMNEVYALAARDPKRWFCSAIDENGTPRLWAKGASEEEVRKKAELAVTGRRDRMQDFREMAPRSDWTFVTYARSAGHDQAHAGQGFRHAGSGDRCRDGADRRRTRRAMMLAGIFNEVVRCAADRLTYHNREVN